MEGAATTDAQAQRGDLRAVYVHTRRIGAGLGGLAWADVRAGLERATTGTGLTLVVVLLPRG